MINNTPLIIELLGLKETTTNRQMKQGTRQFYDPITDVSYATYATGYVRRIYKAKLFPWIHVWSDDQLVQRMYPLNKRKKSQSIDETTYCLIRGNQRQRMELLFKGVTNHRNSAKALYLKHLFPTMGNKLAKLLSEPENVQIYERLTDTIDTERRPGSLFQP